MSPLTGPVHPPPTPAGILVTMMLSVIAILGALMLHAYARGKTDGACEFACNEATSGTGGWSVDAYGNCICDYPETP